MAAFDLQEQEQLAELKALWSKWGPLVVGVVLAAVVGYLGRVLWHAHEVSVGMAADNDYQLVQKAFDAKDAAGTLAAAQTMVKKEPSQAITARAMLLAAKMAFDKKDLAHARSALEWVAGHAKEDDIADIASLRLAAVLIDQNQPDAALKVLATPKSKAFAALFADSRGDALLVKGDKAGAKAAYKAAVDLLNPADPAYKYVQTKQLALGA